MSMEEPLVASWKNVQKAMKAQVGEEVYSNFLGTLLPLRKGHDGVVVLTTPCRTYPSLIRDRYAGTLKSCLQMFDPTVTNITVEHRSVAKLGLSRPELAEEPEAVVRTTSPAGRTVLQPSPNKAVPEVVEPPLEEAFPEEFKAEWEGVYTAPIGPRKPLIVEIQDAVSRHFNVPRVGRMSICGISRQAKVVYPRQLAMYLAWAWTRHSQVEIARRFGGRDHTTVLYASRKMNELDLQNLGGVRQDISAIAARLPFLSIYKNPA